MGAAQNCQEPSAPSFPQPVYDNTKTTVKSTFGAMTGYSISKFGSIKTVIETFFLILLIILIIYAVVSWLSMKPEKKIPYISPRSVSAAFGRQIKAIRKM